jgi:hypothetical protein
MSNRHTAQEVMERPDFISPKEIAKRWQCARSSVDRIARRHRFTRVCLGEGENGMVRYLRKEVESYEASRRVVIV